MAYEEPEEIHKIRKVVNLVLNAFLPAPSKFIDDHTKASAIVCMRYDDWIAKIRQYPDFPMRSDLSVAAAPVCFECHARVVMVDEVFRHYQATPEQRAVCRQCISDHLAKYGAGE